MTCVCRTGAFGSDSCSLIHSCINVGCHPSCGSPARSRSNQPRNPGTTYAYGTHCKYSPAFFFGPSVTRHLMWAIHLNTRGGRQTIGRTQRGHKQHLKRSTLSWFLICYFVFQCIGLMQEVDISSSSDDFKEKHHTLWGNFLLFQCMKSATFVMTSCLA